MKSLSKDNNKLMFFVFLILIRRFWGLLGWSWPLLAALGPLLAALGPLLASLGSLLARLEPLPAALGPLLAALGSLLVALGPLWAGARGGLTKSTGSYLNFVRGHLLSICLSKGLVLLDSYLVALIIS